MRRYAPRFLHRRSPVSAVVAALALATGLAACGSSGGGNGESTPAPSSSGAAKPIASYSALTGTSTTVTLTKSFSSALSSLGLVPRVTAPAKLTDSAITLPITGGHATVYAKGARSPQFTGTIKHGGELQLTAQGVKVGLRNFVLRLGAKSTLSGQILVNGSPFGSDAFTMFDLDTSTMTAPKSSGGTTTLSGGTVYVDTQAASALNTAFGIANTSKALPTRGSGLKVGTATIVLKG